ncbi:MAG: SpoIID/LytB domain-containing protein, partial [Oscillospiraceae bacterium]
MKKNILFFVVMVSLFLALPLLSLIEKKDAKPLEVTQEKNKYLVLNHVNGEVMSLSPLEYVTGVVAAEMPINYSVEALKAQAVASHTYIIRQIGLEQKNKTPSLNGAYISTDSAKYQAFISKEELEKKWGDNFTVNWDKLSGAVKDVIDKVISYENKPIVAAYCAISNGKTVNSGTVWGRELAYLTPVIAPGDEMSPDFEEETVISFEETSKKIKAEFLECQLPENNDDWLEVISTNEQGYVQKVKVGNLQVS